MRYELSDYEWTAIKPMLPNKPRGVRRVNDRRVLNGIFWVLRSGAPWRDLPENYGPRTTCYNRFVRWRRAGVWDRIMDALAAGCHATSQNPQDSRIEFSMIHRGSAFGGPTMGSARSDWENELECWLKPFLDRLGHRARRRMCPRYVAGLIGPGERKSIQPMAERFAAGEYDQLHHFIADGVWDAALLETELLKQADRLVGGENALLVIDDTAVPKKGEHSVGVAAQYASALGKTANCQTLVSLTLARGEVPAMIALRLFLPESWTSNAARLKRAGVPVEYQSPRSKPAIALAEIDRAMTAGVRFGCVLADAGYGLSAPFRQGLTARGVVWAVGIPRHLKVYPVGVKLIWPVAQRGRPRKRHISDVLSRPAEDMLAGTKWQNVSWRTGTKGRLKARFAAVRVRIADGPPQRIKDKG